LRVQRRHTSRPHAVAVSSVVIVLVVALAGRLAAAAGAQAPALPQAPSSRDEPGIRKIELTAGRSTVLATDFDIVRIAVTNPAVADAVVVAPREVLIDGKSNGTISLIVWGSGQRVQYDLVVEQGVSNLQQQLQALFPGEDIQVNANDEAIVLSGHVSNNDTMLRAAEIAAATSSKARVINMLQLPGGMESQQVMLQVRFAEVNRRALVEIGTTLFTGPAGYKDFLARTTTEQFAAPNFDTTVPSQPKLTFSDYLNLFVLNTKYNLGFLIQALQTRGLFQSLAEPNLIAYNGQEASFLAGGEFPVPVVQGATGTVTIVFKEFGIRLNFKPTIAGDVIRLKVRPEVSALDFSNGVTLSGFRIPALTTRRAETDVELRDGQSFAIAGLLDNISQEDRAAVPILSSLPIIGNLFKSKSERAERTELMVLITPRLVRPLNPDEVPPLPTRPKSFLPPEDAIGEELQGGGGAVDAPAPDLKVEGKQKKKGPENKSPENKSKGQ
jgi:pilus assembly protein CpaC